MSTTTSPRPTGDTTTRYPKLLHLYWCHMLEGRVPGPGDKTLCGYTRTTPPNRGIPFERNPDTCVVCMSIRDGIRA